MRTTTILALTLIASACSAESAMQAEGWGLGEDLHEDLGAPAPPSSSDMEQMPLPDDLGPPPEGCLPTVARVASLQDELPQAVSRAPAIHDGRLIVHRRGGPMDRSLFLQSVDPATLEVTPLSMPPSDPPRVVKRVHFVGANRFGQLTYFSMESVNQAPPWRELHVAWNQDAPYPLPGYVEQYEPLYPPLPTPLSRPPLRSVSDELAVSAGDGEAAVFWRETYYGLQHPSLRPNTFPQVAGEMVAWTHWDGEAGRGALYRWRASTPEVAPAVVFEDTHAISWFSLDDDGTAWIDADGAAWYRGHGSGATVPVHPGPCQALDLHDDTLALLCFEGGEPNGAWPGGNTITLWDATTREGREVARGAVLAAPRLDAQGLAWLQYEALSALCRPGPDTIGEVRYLALDVPEAEPLVVGRVGSPCLCCGAFWPPVDLALEGDLLSWTYFIAPGTTGPPRPGPQEPVAAGYGLLDRSCRPD